MAETTADIVRVIFEATGANEVSRVFESIESRMSRFEKSSSQTAASGVKERIRAAQNERKEREALYASMFKEIDAKEKAATKSADAAAKARAKAEANAARDRLRSEEELARQQQRIRDNSARQAGRIAEQQAAAEIRASERAARERTRIAERAARDIADRNKRIAGGIVGTVGGATSRVLGGASMLAGAALAIGGGASFADSIRDELQAGRAAAVLSNSAFIKGAEGASGIRVSPEALLAKAKGIQAATGIDKNQVLAGMQSYVAKTGSAEILGANDSMVLEAAKLSKATGAEFGNVMGAVGILRSQNVNLGTEAGSQMLRDLVAQGKRGSVEMSDLATIAGKVTASSAMYQGSQTDAQRKLLGLSQIAIKTAGSPEEAATAISRLGSDTLAHGAALRAAGLNLSDAKTGLLASPEQILSQVLGAAGGNLGKVQQMGFGERSIKLFEALAPSYQNAFAAAKGTEKERTAAAMAAVSAEVSGFTAAKFSKEDVENDLAVVMQSKAEKIDMAMMRLKEILADKGVPLFERFINGLDRNLPQIERFLDRLAGLAEWFANNPFAGLGTLVLATIAKDVAGAAIGAGVKRAIVAALEGVQAGAANPRSLLPTGVGAPGAGGSIGAAAGAGVVAAVVAGALDVAHGIDTTTGARDRGEAKARGTAVELGNIDRALRAGTLSPEEAKKARDRAQSLLDQGKAGGSAEDVMRASFVGGSALEAIGLGGVVGSKQAQEKIGEAAGIREAQKPLEEALKALTKTLESQGARASTGNGSLADPNNPTRNQAHSAPRVAQ